MADNTLQTLKNLRDEQAQIQRGVDQVEAEQTVRSKRRDKLVQQLRDDYGLELDGVDAWLEAQEAKKAEALKAATEKKEAAATGLALIKRAQAGEDVDLSSLVPSTADEDDLP